MMRQSSSRNHKNKGLRVKSVLQICVLGAVCLWLLYQLKHSYDKKRAFDERSSGVVNSMVDDRLDAVRLGRKDLPEGQITVSTIRETNNKEDENEEAEEEEDQELRKLDAENQGDVDDAIDEQDHERDDEQDDQERGDEERGNEESEMGEDSKEEDNERHNDREEEIEFSDDQENEQSSSHKAHEESYNKDDASSAMPQEYNTTRTEDENGSMHEEQANFIEEKGVDKQELAKVQDDGSANSNNSDVSGVNTTGNVSTPTNIPTTEQRDLQDTTDSRNKSAADDHVQLSVNSTTSPPTENQEKFQTDSSVTVADNQTKVEVNSTNVDAMADNVPAENRSLNNSAVEHQRAEVEVGTPELDLNDTKEEAIPNRTDEQEVSEDHSREPLDMNEKEDSIVEKETRIDLSTLPDVQAEAISVEEKAAE